MSIPFDSMASSGAITSLHCIFQGSEASVLPRSSFSPRHPHLTSAFLSFQQSPNPLHVLACSSPSPGMHPVSSFPTLSLQVSRLPNLEMMLRKRSSINVSATKDACQSPEVKENSRNDNVKRDITSDGLLPDGLQRNLLPKHVAMIMDGHSRWAEKRGLAIEGGHRQGVTVVLPEIVQLSSRWGMEALTVFAFSMENWYRPKAEVNFYMSMIEFLLNEQAENWKSYSGRYDILQACQQLTRQVEVGKLKSTDITELLFEKQLKTGYLGYSGSPDLLIRTSGEQRLSNFLLWQMAYTELYFTDALWPEFEESLYVKALQSFQQRKRRFGKRNKD